MSKNAINYKLSIYYKKNHKVNAPVLLKYKKYAKTPVEEREEYAIRAEMNSEYWNKVRQEYRNATLQYAKKFGIIF